MNKQQLWHKVKRDKIPKGRHCVKCKWVFKIKRNGIFHACLVACGYSQIPGVDFSENYSPVVCDVTFRILILVLIVFSLKAKIVDMETAVLYGNIEEETFMECPPGMTDVKQNEVLALNKCIYGLVQAARQYHKKAVEVLHKIGFKGGDVNPCLFWKQYEKGVVFVEIYVDDNLIVGHPDAIEDTIEQLKKNGFVVKVENDLKYRLYCEIRFNSDRTKAWSGQPRLLANLERKFGKKQVLWNSKFWNCLPYK